MEEDIDIYADLPSFNLEEDGNLVEKNKRISEKCTKLEIQVNDLTQSLESLQKINNNLEVNLSSLLKTAKAEIARKDRMIAEIRQQLDNIQFRRGDYSRSAKPTRRSPPKRKRENSPKEVDHVSQVSDVTEFVCGNPLPSSNNDANGMNKLRQLDGIVSTVFGERLRRRILGEQEEERKQKEQSRVKAEQDSKKIPESLTSNVTAANDAQSSLRADNLESDCRINSVARLRNNESSLGSNSSFNSQEDVGFTGRNNCDRKRQSEDQVDVTNSRKKSKSNDGKSRCRDNDNSDREIRSSCKNSSKKSKSRERTCAEIVTSDDYAKFRAVDDDLHIKSKSVSTTFDNEAEDRHNRVAIRLMLLAEGIDPDLEAKNLADNEQRKDVDDRRESRKRNDATSRSRSKSRNRRHRRRSRSRTPNGRRRSRQSDDRYKRSRDRFDRRRDSKNKDGDNLSEFSREIHELKERIEHRVDDRSVDRTEKSGNLNRYKRNDDRNYRSGRSRTPDSGRGGSKKRTVHTSRAERKSGRSQSRERHKSRNKGEPHANIDGVSTKDPKIVVLETDKTENSKVVPTNSSSQAAENPETKSLLSLEEGEIVDSAGSSPVKIVNPLQSLKDEIVPTNCTLNNLSDFDELPLRLADVKSTLPSRDIGHSQNNEKPVFLKKLPLSIPESNRPTALNDSLNSSKDERIENIAKFIANFPTDSSKCKSDEQANDKITHNDDVHSVIKPNTLTSEEQTSKEKIQCVVNTVFQGSAEDSPLILPPIENNDAVNIENTKGNNGDEDWCLIAIDSPVKNFEENRKSRMMAQNVQITTNCEPPKNASTDEPLPKQFNEASETFLTDESHIKIVSESAKTVSDKHSKSLVQTMKNPSITKPAVLTSLRSTYHKGRKEMILSDTNSEQCTRMNFCSSSKSLSDESETLHQSRNDIDKSVESKNSKKKTRSKSPLLEDIDRNYGSCGKGDEKHSTDVSSSKQSDLKNISSDKETNVGAKSDITIMKKVDSTTVTPCVDELNKKNEKSKGNNSKQRKEAATNINVYLKPELRNTSKIDASKSIGSKSKAGRGVERTNENKESSISKCSENGTKLGKTVSKLKADGNNSKQKKEPRKLIVFARRRKPVHLEDSSTSSSVVMIPNSLIDTVDDSKKTTHDNVESHHSRDVDSETWILQGENPEQIIARNDFADDQQSEV